MWTSEEQSAHRELWRQTLLSGEFKQCKDFLCKDGKYCCLGVACELFKREGNEIEVTDGYWPGEKNFGGERFYLPKVVQDWLGITETGCLNWSNYLNLAHMNDNDKTFEEIAAEFPNLRLCEADND